MSPCRKIILLVSMVLPAMSHAETLPALIQEALAKNPELRATHARVEAAMGRAGQTRLWPNPELELSAEDMPADHIGLSRSQNMIGVAQTVPFPGKKSLDTQIGRREITAAENDYLVREREIVRDVKAAFYHILTAEKKVAVSQELLDLAETTTQTAAKRVAAGDAGNQEQLRAEIELDRARVEVSAARRELTEAQKELAMLLGRARQPLGTLEGELSESLKTSYAVLEHPRIAAARAQREAAELEWQRAKLAVLPDVTFGVAGGRDTAANESLLEFRVSLPLPIFDRAQGHKREARALAELARHDLTAVEQRLQRDFDTAQARLRAAGEQVEAYRSRILPKAEEALKLVRGGFDAGKFDFLDLVDTQRTLAEARLAYLDKLLELNLARADLEALAGEQPAEE